MEVEKKVMTEKNIKRNFEKEADQTLKEKENGNKKKWAEEEVFFFLGGGGWRERERENRKGQSKNAAEL